MERCLILLMQRTAIVPRYCAPEAVVAIPNPEAVEQEEQSYLAGRTIH